MSEIDDYRMMLLNAEQDKRELQAEVEELKEMWRRMRCYVNGRIRAKASILKTMDDLEKKQANRQEVDGE